MPTRKKSTRKRAPRKKKVTSKDKLPTRRRSKRRRYKKNSEAGYRIEIKSKLSDTLIAEACELIKEGLSRESVCAYLGITPHTMQDWQEKGEKYLLELHTRRGPEFHEDELEADFLMALARSKAELELEIVRELRDDKAHARWVRNMTILERRFRKAWGRNESLRVDMESIAPDEAYL